MTASQPNKAQTRVPLVQWAKERGVPRVTAWRWADSGVLNGRDAAHPLAWKEGCRWYVAPDVYRAPAPEPEVPASEQAQRLVRALREWVNDLEAALQRHGVFDDYAAPTPRSISRTGRRP